MSQPITQDAIQDVCEPLYGLPCWGVKWDDQLNLSMNFGVPHLVIRDPYISKASSQRVRQLMASRVVTLRGEWWLWIFCAYWKLSLQDSEPITGAASKRSIERALAWLDGQKLEIIETNTVTAATRFSFDLGAVLEARRFDMRSSGDLWTLYTPLEHTLSVFGNGTFRYEPMKRPERQKHIQLGKPSRVKRK